VFTSQSDSVSWSDMKSLTEVLSVKSFDPNVQWEKYVCALPSYAISLS